ncbi:hypothetical protein JKF63_06527 [Porcisia hertigi]|uniref:Phosphatidic acid phosphatase type 2/haloperoxidase domain-containing protein n=1 Tax=Porcisia hertigi TaxID=2761500 RepID=A0A836LIJ4_9TRYP|nr:hypothetical protein JKF63_06527 [Porcisia hertigi]
MSHRALVSKFILWRVPDYIVFVVVGFVAIFLDLKARPFCRTVDWSDPSINHPYARKEGFPTYSLPIATILIIFLYVGCELCVRSGRHEGKRNMWLHINGWVLAHLLSIALAYAMTSALKLYAGRLRPDFLSRLRKEGITEVTWATMTRDEQCRAAREGRLSFPSGHSSVAFSGYVPPSMYLMGLMRTFKGGRLWLVTVSLLLLILPMAIAISRTVDYRHHFDDVLAGAICGAACGVLCVVMSFRPSRRGEWTLRDHPDDEREAETSQGFQP